MITELYKLYPLQAKAWELKLSEVDEGYLCCDIIVFAENRGKAKSALLTRARHEGLDVLNTGEEITYLNIPVQRSPASDKFLFEDEALSGYRISEILVERERLKKLDELLKDESITHCYICRHGQYYRPRYCGYTSSKISAGVYLTADAVRHARGVADIKLLPVNPESHNQLIIAEIAKLESNLITDNASTIPPQSTTGSHQKGDTPT
nr:hypothetical protein [uncultured Flavobacterium sp.]